VSPETLRLVGIADVGASHTHKWANYFTARGHHVHLVSYAAFAPAARRRLLPAVSVEDWTIPPFHLKRPWITLPAVARLRRIVRAQRADVVQVHFLGPGAWYAALAGGARLALWVMGGGDVQGTWWRPGSAEEGLLSPFALRRARLVTAWSRNLARIVRPMMRARVPCEVVVGGVDTEFFRRREDAAAIRSGLGLAPGDFVILSCRLLWPRQNILALVQALPLIRERLARARLVIVRYRAEQAAEYARHVEGEIDRLGLRPYVRLVAEIPNPEMPSYLGAADCVVSIPDTDGTPMTVMEAAACGTPCLLHDLPDYDPEVFVHEESVLRVPLLDPEGLAAAVIRIASDGALRTRLRQGGREMVERHASLGVEMGRLEALYRQLVRPAA